MHDGRIANIRKGRLKTFYWKASGALNQRLYVMTMAEFCQTVSPTELMETGEIEAQEEEWLNSINTKPGLRGATLMLLEWGKNGHIEALKTFVHALGLYEKQLPKWKAESLARLCTIMACDSFELANPDM